MSEVPLQPPSPHHRNRRGERARNLLSLGRQPRAARRSSGGGAQRQPRALRELRGGTRRLTSTALQRGRRRGRTRGGGANGCTGCVARFGLPPPAPHHPPPLLPPPPPPPLPLPSLPLPAHSPLSPSPSPPAPSTLQLFPSPVPGGGPRGCRGVGGEVGGQLEPHVLKGHELRSMTAYPKHNMLFSVQGYLAYKKPPPRRTLQEDHA